MELKQLFNIIFVFMTISISEIWSRAVPSAMHAVLLVSPYDSSSSNNGLGLVRISRQDESHQSRQKRQLYDPYAEYAQYYPKKYRGYSDYYDPQASSYESDSPPPPPPPPSRRRQGEQAQQQQQQNDAPKKSGNKYVYQPLFQYKATQQKRRKLFVPNLFG